MGAPDTGGLQPFDRHLRYINFIFKFLNRFYIKTSALSVGWKSPPPLVSYQPDIVVVDKQEKRAVVVDVAISSKIRKKEHEKIKRYQGLKEE